MTTKERPNRWMRLGALAVAVVVVAMALAVLAPNVDAKKPKDPTLKFDESGLPANLLDTYGWTVTVWNNTTGFNVTESSTTSHISFSVPAEVTYNWTTYNVSGVVTHPHPTIQTFDADPLNGTVAVAYATVVVDIQFSNANG